MLKETLKSTGLVIVIVVLGIVVLGIVGYFRTQDAGYRAMHEQAELERKYLEDAYGGATPEETLRLFVEALKAGDTELAAKYFILDEQERWRADLAKIKDRGLLDEMVADLEREKYKNQISDGQVAFDIANDQKEAMLSILLGRGPNGKWKIVDM